MLDMLSIYDFINYDKGIFEKKNSSKCLVASLYHIKKYKHHPQINKFSSITDIGFSKCVKYGCVEVNIPEH